MDDASLNKLFRNFIESMYAFIAIDEDGCISYISNHYCSLLDRPQEELIGLPVEDVIPNTRLPIVLQRKREELGRHMFVENSVNASSICNRMLVYDQGERSPERIVGAMAYGILMSDEDADHVQGELDLLRQQNSMLRTHITQMYQTSYSLDEILGSSQRITAMKGLIRRVANTPISVCIMGETGTGKELVANAIHKLSKRSNRPFVKINCAAIPKDLIESELFGYEPGAFTGAARQGKIGMFELANHGTLLLDEIGEMPLNLQAKLLRVLQEGELKRVGGTAVIPIDVRLICSTNQNLKQMVSDGLFRADLYYRVNTMEILVPPLRERLEDIRTLAPHFVERANEHSDLAVTGLHERVYSLFDAYSWPGNIRELEHSIERACVLCGQGQLDVTHFGFLAERIPQDGAAMPGGRPAISLKSKNDILEQQAILEALAACGGNRTAAAQLLGVSRATLYNKLKRLGIDI